MIVLLSTLVLAASPTQPSDLACAQWQASLIEHDCADRLNWSSTTAHNRCLAERADIVEDLAACSGIAVTGQERDTLLPLQADAIPHATGKVTVSVVGNAVCTTNAGSEQICTVKSGQSIVIVPSATFYGTPNEAVTEQIRRLSLSSTATPSQ